MLDAQQAASLEVKRWTLNVGGFPKRLAIAAIASSNRYPFSCSKHSNSG
jgi:hypothetical protein